MKNLKQSKNNEEDFWMTESPMHDVSQAIFEDELEEASLIEGYTAG